MGLFGGGSKSTSKSYTTVKVNASDKRAVADNGAVAATGDGNTVNVLDKGAIASAFKFAEVGDAIRGEGFARLLDTAKSMFGQQAAALGGTQQLIADSIGQQAEQSGGIDNKTMVALALALVAGVVAWGWIRK
ncbi:MAG: hypothetical protein AB1592_18945 [Pseudomonadota bacterium]